MADGDIEYVLRPYGHLPNRPVCVTRLPSKLFSFFVADGTTGDSFTWRNHCVKDQYADKNGSRGHFGRISSDGFVG